MDAMHTALRSWQQHSRAGLAASLVHQPALARTHHAQAVQLAQALLALPDGEVSDDDRCAAFVVGHLNLRIGQEHKAEENVWDEALGSEIHGNATPVAIPEDRCDPGLLQ